MRSVYLKKVVPSNMREDINIAASPTFMRHAISRRGIELPEDEAGNWYI